MTLAINAQRPEKVKRALSRIGKCEKSTFCTRVPVYGDV